MPINLCESQRILHGSDVCIALTIVNVEPQNGVALAI